MTVDEMQILLTRAKDGEPIDRVLDSVPAAVIADQHVCAVMQAVFCCEPEWRREIERRHHEAFARDVAEKMYRDDVPPMRKVVGTLVAAKISQAAEWAMQKPRYNGMHARDIAAIYARHLPDLDLGPEFRASHQFRQKTREKNGAEYVDKEWVSVPLRCLQYFEKAKIEPA